MGKFAINKFSRIIFLLIATVLVSMSVFSMSAMRHQNTVSGNCVEAMENHSAGLARSQSADSCVDFHLSLMEKFSHGFSNGSALEFVMAVLVLAFFFLIGGLFDRLKDRLEILRTRLRLLSFDIISAFRDNFGHWLSLSEKRDPSHVFTTA